MNFTYKRLVLAGVALVLAIVAGVSSYLFLHDVQKRAYHNAKLVFVYTISGNVAQGTPGNVVISRGQVKRGQIPLQFRPTDAVTDLATIRNEVAVANLTPGQIVTADLFASPQSAIASASQAIPKGDVAITVAVDPVHSVAGLIHPGDQVDILVETTPGVEQFLYQNVSVLAVGTSVGPSSGYATASASPTTTAPANASGLITFAVPPAAALRIALAQSEGGGVTGQLYLALVPPGNSPAAVGSVKADNLIPATLTPS